MFKRHLLHQFDNVCIHTSKRQRFVQYIGQSNYISWVCMLHNSRYLLTFARNYPLIKWLWSKYFAINWNTNYRESLTKVFEFDISWVFWYLQVCIEGSDYINSCLLDKSIGSLVSIEFERASLRSSDLMRKTIHHEKHTRCIETKSK